MPPISKSSVAVDHCMSGCDRKMELYETFGRYDKDQDGLISMDEAHDVLHQELGFTEDRSRAMVKKFDLNNDGMVSYIEFAEFYLAVEERWVCLPRLWK